MTTSTSAAALSRRPVLSPTEILDADADAVNDRPSSTTSQLSPYAALGFVLGAHAARQQGATRERQIIAGAVGACAAEIAALLFVKALR